MLPEIYSNEYGFPRRFFHNGMIYEWCSQCFADMSGLVFEVKAPPETKISATEIMERLPGDPTFRMAIAIYYNFTVTDIEVRAQLINEESFIYVTCLGSRSVEYYQAWNDSKYPLFTTDVCAPTHLLVKTVQPFYDVIDITPDNGVGIRGDMYSELRKPLSYVEEYRFLFGYGINIHCGIIGYEFLTMEGEEFYKAMLDEMGERKKKESDLLPVDPASSPALHKRIVETANYHLNCLDTFLSPLHFLDIKFTVSWVNTTSRSFNTRNLDMSLIAKISLINGVFVKACTLYEVTVEPICRAGTFFTSMITHVSWPDIYHSISRIYTALQSNSGILMLGAVTNREIVYADDRQFICATMLPMPISFAYPSIPHRDAADLVKFIDDLQPYFFYQDEHGTDYAFPVSRAVQDDFILLFVRMDMYYARNGGLEAFRKSINALELGIEILADTSAYLYFAVVDALEIREHIGLLPDPNKSAFPYSFCGVYGHNKDWEAVKLVDALKFFIHRITQSSSPNQFLAAEDKIFESIIEMCRKSNIRSCEYPAFAWEANVNFMTRPHFQSAWVTAMHEYFTPPPLSPEMEKVLDDLNIDHAQYGRFLPTRTPDKTEEKKKSISSKSFAQKIVDRFKKK